MVDGLIKVDHFQKPHEWIQQDWWEIPDIVDFRTKRFHGQGCARVFWERRSGDWLFVKHTLTTELNKMSISVFLSGFMSEARKI